MPIPLWQAALLGFIQGLTEFLPVSSTAHLALAQKLLPGFSQPGILFDVMLHVGTLGAVFVYFRSELIRIARGAVSPDADLRKRYLKLIGCLILAVGMTGAVAMPLKKLAVESLENARGMGFALLATAVLLSVTQFVGFKRGDRGRAIEEIRWRDAALIGFCQAFSALFHGFSRSGNTVSVGLFTGLSRRAAAEFSFLLSIPTILAAATVENISAYRHHTLVFASPGQLPSYLVGMVVAALVGYVAVALLFRLVLKMKLYPFVIYCASLGTLLLFLTGV